MPPVLRTNHFKAWSAVGLVLLATLANAQAPTPGPAPQTPVPGRQWDTSEAVQKSMERIRQAMHPHQAGIDHSRLQAPDYQGLAAVIEQAVATMAATRTGTKEAETALHLVVLVDLKHSLELMRTGPTVALQRVGALGVQQALRNYDRYFKHPGG